MPSDIKRQVRGIFVTPAGDPVTNKTLTFFRSRRVVTPAGSSTVVDEPFFATTDGTGLLDKEMFAGNYLVLVKLSDVDRYFNLAVPDEAGPHNPADLVDTGPVDDSILTQVQQLVLKARAWAENPEDVEVDPTNYPDEYSALHWAAKSLEGATLSADAATDSANSATAAANSATQAEQAKTDTENLLGTKVSKTGDTMTGELVVDTEGVGGSAESAIHIKGTNTASARMTFERFGNRGAVDVVGSNLRLTGIGDGSSATDGGISFRTEDENGVQTEIGQFEHNDVSLRSNLLQGFQEKLLVTPAAYGASTAKSSAANDAYFADMETQLGNRIVDLMGTAWPVTHVPDLPGADNGFFKVENEEGAVDILHPAGRTMSKTSIPLTYGITNSAWAQDNACWDDGMQEGYGLFSENNNHGIEDGSARAICMRSRDGLNWTREELDFGFPCVVFAHRVYGGCQMAIVRDESDGPSQGKVHMFVRQLAQRVEIDSLENVNGTNIFRFYKNDMVDAGRPLMLYETAEVQFNGLPSDFGGLDLDEGVFACSFRSGNRYEFRSASNFTSQETITGTFEANILQSDWFEVTFDAGRTFGEEVEFVGGGSGEPVIVHGISMLHDGGDAALSTDQASMGNFFCGISGNQFNAAVAYVTNIVDENAKGNVEWVTEIPGAAAALTEVTVQTFPDSDKICGFSRTQDANGGQTVPALFFTSPSATAAGIGTVTTSNLPLGAYEESPISIQQMDGNIYAFGSLERNGDDQQGERRMMLMRADIDDAFADGADAFEHILVEKAEYRNQTLGGGATGVGVPSLTRWGRNGKTLAAFWNREINPNNPYVGGVDTVTQIVATKLTFERNLMDLMGPEQIAWGHVPAPQWKLRLRGLPATADGQTLLWEIIDEESAPVSYDQATGVLTYMVSGEFRVGLQMSYEPNVGTNFVSLRNAADDAYLNEGQLLAVDYGRTVQAYFDGSGNVIPADELVGGETLKAIYKRQSAAYSSCRIKVKAGDTMQFKLNASGGCTNSTVRNFAEIELLEMF